MYFIPRSDELIRRYESSDILYWCECFVRLSACFRLESRCVEIQFASGESVWSHYIFFRVDPEKQLVFYEAISLKGFYSVNLVRNLVKSVISSKRNFGKSVGRVESVWEVRSEIQINKVNRTAIPKTAYRFHLRSEEPWESDRRKTTRERITVFFHGQNIQVEE